MNTQAQPMSQKAQDFKNNVIQSITLDQAKKLAPAIGATNPASYTTKRYNFTSTEEVISHMQDLGYILTGASQAGTNQDLRKNYGAHMVNFQHPDLYIKDSQGNVEARPQLILTNSHDGTKPIQFDMGLFRLVCANGLIAKSHDFGSFRERHSKLTIQGLKDILQSKIDTLPKTIEKINSWVSREMTSKERHQFAADAIRLRAGEEKQPELYEINSILETRRPEDNGTNLWRTFNVCQENLIKGGFQMNNRQVRAVTNPWSDLTLNQGIWQLAEQYV